MSRQAEKEVFDLGKPISHPISGSQKPERVSVIRLENLSEATKR